MTYDDFTVSEEPHADGPCKGSIANPPKDDAVEKRGRESVVIGRDLEQGEEMIPGILRSGSLGYGLKQVENSCEFSNGKVSDRVLEVVVKEEELRTEGGSATDYGTIVKGRRVDVDEEI